MKRQFEARNYERAKEVAEKLIEKIKEKKDPVTDKVYENGWVPIRMLNVLNTLQGVTQAEFNPFRSYIYPNICADPHIINRIQKESEDGRPLPLNMRSFEYKWVSEEEKKSLGARAHEMKYLTWEQQEVIWGRLKDRPPEEGFSALSIMNTLANLKAAEKWISIKPYKVAFSAGILQAEFLEMLGILQGAKLLLFARTDDNLIRKENNVIRIFFDTDSFDGHKREISDDGVLIGRTLEEVKRSGNWAVAEDVVDIRNDEVINAIREVEEKYLQSIRQKTQVSAKIQSLEQQCKRMTEQLLEVRPSDGLYAGLREENSKMRETVAKTVKENRKLETKVASAAKDLQEKAEQYQTTRFELSKARKSNRDLNSQIQRMNQKLENIAEQEKRVNDNVFEIVSGIGSDIIARLNEDKDSIPEEVMKQLQGYIMRAFMDSKEQIEKAIVSKK